MSWCRGIKGPHTSCSSCGLPSGIHVSENAVKKLNFTRFTTARLHSSCVYGTTFAASSPGTSTLQGHLGQCFAGRRSCHDLGFPPRWKNDREPSPARQQCKPS
ncbi:uncharacterized protein Tco025E_05010 [Trypanosoma conorhini]|uniref:Uncharacterized protein n=1 Tax=Trypanosoma conorhini TaxID=83891 RepID=A0A3R7KX61_9TRYP|nr:uncharacterized protein Tco025E_05010 [Trypanosoma conorhini]RNF16914.1 hypothetical protein Tco025E_05010 [Trypanosoma conorhini]